MRPPRIITLIFFLTATLFLASRSVAYLSTSGSKPHVPSSGSHKPDESPQTPAPAPEHPSQPHRQHWRPPPVISPDTPSQGWSLNEISRRFTLFPPLALVSLMDDNNTAFSARPAAFGPYLEASGLSGQLWVGSSFSDDHLPEGEGDGELGCSDIPNWGLQIPGGVNTVNALFGAQRQPQPNDKEKAPSSSVTAAGASSLLMGVSRHAAAIARNGRIRSRSFDAHGGPPASDRLSLEMAIAASHNDGTDDYLHQDALARMTRAQKKATDSSSFSLGPSDIKSMQETAEIAGKIVLLSRGGCGFLEKVKWAQRRGALALIIGDNRKGGPLIQMYARGDTSNVTIPSIFVSHTTGQLLSALSQPGSFIEDSVNEFGQPSFKVQHSDKASGAAKAKKPAAVGIKSKQPQTSSKKWPWHMFAWDLDSSGAAPRSSFVSSAETSQPQNSAADPDTTTASGDDKVRQGLWITITPSGNASSFLDTILIVFVSPVITLTVVYTCVMLRTRIQNQRWRVPKSLVQRLPVRTYHRPADSASPLPSPRLPSPSSSSPTTPLLQSSTTAGLLPDRAEPENGSGAGLGHSGYFRVAEALSNFAQRSGGVSNPVRTERKPKPTSQWQKYMGRQSECVVCLEEYVDGVSQVMSLPCGHEFHEECITPWLTNRRRTCPICKGDVVQYLQHDGSDSSSILSSEPPSPQNPGAVERVQAAMLVDLEAQAPLRGRGQTGEDAGGYTV
ncbi:E3 ubiquitin-protein ligase RNF167 [Ceratocystis fimbriata CBS 114723]|uniref:E3 ubiquitin-protein ligase RNF167 n=1 Tax=Ceratocystis fimbriata CBS 114723 TaxID=1035309 RepID=A0A2C5WZ35_9PEZI|nr:E3 ubiquitin-protein ligase RNF167 [Ceratocystis fimbriata CBS 114723]